MFKKTLLVLTGLGLGLALLASPPQGARANSLFDDIKFEPGEINKILQSDPTTLDKYTKQFEDRLKTLGQPLDQITKKVLSDLASQISQYEAACRQAQQQLKQLGNNNANTNQIITITGISGQPVTIPANTQVSTAKQQLQDVCDQFNQLKVRQKILTQSGGSGINLTSAGRSALAEYLPDRDECSPIKQGGGLPVDFLACLLPSINALAVFAAVIVIAYAGFQYISSGGTPEQISQAKDLIIGALLGLVAIFLIGAFLDFMFTSELTIPSGPAPGLTGSGTYAGRQTPGSPGANNSAKPVTVQTAKSVRISIKIEKRGLTRLNPWVKVAGWTAQYTMTIDNTTTTLPAIEASATSSDQGYLVFDTPPIKANQNASILIKLYNSKDKYRVAKRLTINKEEFKEALNRAATTNSSPQIEKIVVI